MAFVRRPRRLEESPTVGHWACRAIVSACLLSCGGLAADGPGGDAVGWSESIPEDGASPTRPVRESCADNPLLAECPRDTRPPVRPVRETCEDNPLLAGCPGDNLGGGAPSSSGGQGAAPEVPDEMPLIVAAARNVLMSYCGACHGAPLTEAQASGAFNYVDDWDRLNRTGLIEACSPESSRIIEVMRSGEMPPSSSGLPRVTEMDLDVVVEAIEFECRLE